MVIVQLTTDNRQDAHQYEKDLPWFGTAPEALLQGFAAQPDIRVHVVSCTQQPLRSPEKLAPNIWFHSLHVPKAGWLRTGYGGCIRAVRQRLRDIRPDIVHGQGTERDCAISAVFSGFPNVVTVHGNMRLISKINRALPFSYQWLAARLEQFTLPRAGGVVCITSYTQRAVTGLARRTWVIPNAVDASFFDVMPEPVEPKTILCVGNISPRKNQNRFIEAMDPLASAARFNLVFLGALPEGDGYARRFLELVQARSWCQYGGVAGRDDLKKWLRTGSALVLPSVEDNCPMAVLEAMAAGVPVAASAVGGVPEIIQHERTGVMFDPLLSATIADTVNRLLGDPALVARITLEAKQEGLARFHPAVIARRHLDVYRDVLSTRS